MASNRLLISVFDPDQDFLDAVARAAPESTELKIETHLHTRHKPFALEEYILQVYPDIIVLNLDQESLHEFAQSVKQIRSIPIPMPPIVLATTINDAINLKNEAYRQGVDDYLIRPFSVQDLWLRINSLVNIRRLQQQLDAATRKLSNLNHQLADSNRKLEELSVTDELTGLYNMRYMTRYLETQFEILNRYHRPFAIVMIDLDHFKEVNDNNDHLVGSASIRSVGRTIEAVLRSSDVKARYGGDEFIVALPESDKVAAKQVAERLRQAISETVMIGANDEEFKITASIGVASYETEKHPTYKHLVKDADRAMYEAKERGRNLVIVSNEDQQFQKSSYSESQSTVLTAISKSEERRKRRK